MTKIDKMDVNATVATKARNPKVGSTNRSRRSTITKSELQQNYDSLLKSNSDLRNERDAYQQERDSLLAKLDILQGQRNHEIAMLQHRNVAMQEEIDRLQHEVQYLQQRLTAMTRSADTLIDLVVRLGEDKLTAHMLCLAQNTMDTAIKHYKAMARFFHPDKFHVPKSAELFGIVNRCYERIKIILGPLPPN